MAHGTRRLCEISIEKIQELRHHRHFFPHPAHWPVPHSLLSPTLGRHIMRTAWTRNIRPVFQSWLCDYRVLWLQPYLLHQWPSIAEGEGDRTDANGYRVSFRGDEKEYILRLNSVGCTALRETLGTTEIRSKWEVFLRENKILLKKGRKVGRKATDLLKDTF